MKYETTYNIGDVVWVMYKDKALSGVIYKMTVLNYLSIMEDWNEKISENYDIKFDDGSVSNFKKEKIYTSKEELIKSL